MKKIIAMFMLVVLAFPTKVSAQSTINNTSDTAGEGRKACYTMRVFNDESESSEIIASVEVADEALASKVALTVEEQDEMLYEGSLSNFTQQWLGELLVNDSNEFNYCLRTEEDIDLDEFHASLHWEVELEPIVSYASIEPDVEEVGQACVTPYPAVNQLSVLPVNISKTGLIFIVASFAAGFFVARKK